MTSRIKFSIGLFLGFLFVVPSVVHASVPSISSVAPEDGATGVSRSILTSGEDMYIEFDQSVVAGTGLITIYDASDDSVAATFDVEDEEQVYIEDEFVYLYNEDDSLEFETEYYILIDAGTFDDGLGNLFAGVADETFWSFTTIDAPNVVVDDTFDTGTGFNNQVADFVVDGNGKIVVVGSFNSYNGTGVGDCIARLNADGSLDETFDSGEGFYDSENFACQVYAVALDGDGKIIVGGNFDEYDGASTTDIVRLNTDGSLDETFDTGTGFKLVDNPNQVNLYDIAIDQDGKILAVGVFDEYNAASSTSIVRINTDGSFDTTFDAGAGFTYESVAQGTNPAYMTTVVVDEDGKIIVGGPFDAFDGGPLTGIARLNADGSLDGTFNVGVGLSQDGGEIADLRVHDILITDDGIIVSGNFDEYDDVGIGTGLVRLNADGSLDETFNVGNGFDYAAFSCALSVQALSFDTDNTLVVGGCFDSYDGENVGSSILRLDVADGGLDTAFTTGDGFDGSINKIVLYEDGSLLAGGYFTSYNGETLGYFTRLVVETEEEPEEESEEEEEDAPSSSRRGSSSHRRSSGGGPSITPTTGAPAGSVEALMEQLIVLLTQLLEQLIAEQQGN